MVQLNTNALSPMALGRLNKALAKQYRFDGVIKTLGEHIATLEGNKSEGNGMIDYNRTRFNRMNNADQRAYIQGLEERRYYYVDGWTVPKIVWDCID